MLCAAVALGAAAAPASAAAADRISAVFIAEYGAESYTIDQGEIITFANGDRFLSHGVASDQGAGALFSAPVIPRGATRLVRGAPFLTTGTYPFHCPVHPGMTSVLNVTPSGAPLAPDATAPAARVKAKTGGLEKLLSNGLRLVVTPSEPVDAVIKASAAGVPLGRAERTWVVPGRKAVALDAPPGAAAAVRSRADGPVRLRVRVVLSDAAGNVAKAGATRNFGGAKKPKRTKKV